MDIMESDVVKEHIGQAMNSLKQAAVEAAKLRFSNDGFQLSPTGEFAEEIRSMNICLDVLIRQTRSHQAHTARNHNAALPISQLPDELLIKIFQQILKDREGYYEKLSRLSLVCLHWADLVRCTPSLWFFICTSYPLNIGSMILKNSSKHPLEVWHNEDRGSIYGAAISPVDAKTRIDRIGVHVSRWQRVKLTIRNGSSDKYLPAYLEKLSAPILETLEIDGGANWGDGDAHELFEGGAQRLRHLSLSRIATTWESKLLSGLSNLRTLKLDQNVLSPSVPQIRRLLMVCPNLVKLDLHCGRRKVREKEDRHVLETTMIELLSCISFHLFIDPDVTRFILEHVRAPACTDFRLVIMNSPENTVVGSPLVMSTLDAIGGHFPDLDIEISESSLWFRSQDAAFFYVNIPEDRSPLSTLAWLLHHSHQQPRSLPTSLVITANGEGPFVEQALNMLSSSITSLKLNISTLPHFAIHFLTHPHQMDGALDWPLPSLQRLSFKHCRAFDLWILVQMVESRLGCSVPDESPQLRDPSKLPVELLELQLSRQVEWDPTSPAVKRLEELVRSVWQA
ncbi:hypothetical protein FRB94_011823 [Tulasnella sp. JGI-2019a]|nr:hypothetical protein FRB94_011823 [Tulasnella sp. JGI-2019a]KAG9038980.1 hypothetical protein FRB95_013658 [Tulasnella sp. JGI-2019a]